MKTKRQEKGFSIIELLITMTVVLILMSVVSLVMMRAIGIRTRESSKTDALSSTQAALNVISREVANSGYGLKNNGIVVADSGAKKIRVRANLVNTNNCITEQDEDVNYFYDQATQSIVRTERHATAVCGTTFETQTSAIVNRVSDISFEYWDYTSANPDGVQTTTPTVDTGRVVIYVTVKLDDVRGQPTSQTVTLKSDVTLRNSNFMKNQY